MSVKDTKAEPGDEEFEARATREDARYPARKAAAEAMEKARREYLDSYELDDGEAHHTPTEFEAFLIDDAVSGLLGDEEFVRCWDAWRALGGLPAPSSGLDAGEALVADELRAYVLRIFNSTAPGAPYNLWAKQILAELEILDGKTASAQGEPVVSAYTIDGDARKLGSDDIRIERAKQLEGPALWAVRRSGGVCLNKQGEWEYEPMPSSRDDDFLARCRFASANEAISAARSARGGN